MKSSQLNYTLFGIGFGLFFPILAISADCFLFNSIPLRFEAVFARINANPIHYVIFSAPIVLGFTFYRIGRSIETRNKLTKRLKRSNKAINESNELLDAFNYHVSHDLKTVLNNQLILSQMIAKYAKKNENEKVLELTEKLQYISRNGLTTVLNFLKIGEDGFTFEAGDPIQVWPEINRVLVDNDLQQKLKLIIGRSDFDTLEINAKVFESVLLNLFTNAIKYSEKAPSVRIELLKEDDTRKITVTDNGIGIDLNKYGDHLFMPFKRIKNNLKKEGNGIGLYLIKKMMLSIGGEIEVKSMPDKGTTFTLVFYSQLKEIE